MPVHLDRTKVGAVKHPRGYTWEVQHTLGAFGRSTASLRSAFVQTHDSRIACKAYFSFSLLTAARHSTVGYWVAWNNLRVNKCSHSALMRTRWMVRRSSSWRRYEAVALGVSPNVATAVFSHHSIGLRRLCLLLVSARNPLPPKLIKGIPLVSDNKLREDPLKPIRMSEPQSTPLPLAPADGSVYLAQHRQR